MKLQQLMNVTPHGISRAAAKLQVVGFLRTAETPLTRFSAGFIGVSRKTRKTAIVVDANGHVKVRCSCPFFTDVLALPLAAHRALMEGVELDRRNKLVGSRANKPRLCAHLLRLALIVNSPTATKRMEKRDASKEDDSVTQISSKLKGL